MMFFKTHPVRAFFLGTLFPKVLSKKPLAASLAASLVFSSALVLSAASSAYATTINPLELTQQVKKADLILHIKVKFIDSTQENTGELFWRVYTFEVLETLSGDPKILPANTDDNEKAKGLPTFAILGGGDLVLEGAPILKAFNEEKGQEWSGEYVVMLYKPLSSELGKSYDNPIVGFNQGIYLVQNNTVSTLEGNPNKLEETDKDLKNFKNKIIALQGSK
jgi:hypothetical protein